MKLSKDMLFKIFAAVVFASLIFFVFEGNAWVKAQGDGWSFEAQASATTTLLRK